MFMMSSGGLTAAESVRRQGRDPVGAGGRRRRHGARPGAGRLRPRHRLRHGRHLDRRRAFRRRIRARLRDRSRRRAHARADDAHPHGGGGRRLDPALRRRALSRRAGFGRRQSGPEMLPPRRAARRHRRQCDGRQADPGFLSEDFRAGAGPAARRRERARNSPTGQEIGDGRSEEVADGFIKIAVENMANAIKKISVQRGYDVTRYALNCFGGAGGQHACLVADALGMTKVLIHPLSSLLSAYGMGLADIRATRQQAIEEPLGDKALAARIAATAAARQGRRSRSRRPGRANGRQDHAASCARISATPAPTRRSSEVDAARRALAAMKGAFEARTRRASASSIAPSSWSIEAVNRSKRSAAARKFRARQEAVAEAPPEAGARTRFFRGGKPGTTPLSYARALAPATRQRVRR
jgi:hypothetical protein